VWFVLFFLLLPRNETQCIEKIFFENMPAERVKIVENLAADLW
jgi:hypothetical protein